MQRKTYHLFYLNLFKLAILCHVLLLLLLFWSSAIFQKQFIFFNEERDSEKQSFQTISRTQFQATGPNYLALQAIICNPPLDPAI